ncbi:GntR family transcriptional regulator [Desulfosporosinus sp. FKA]|uniref:GntR family transcriptional regulator n=1 Tax=Desulfosporosinus sp. FKA TaxID=1969834 RepID=UPI001554C3AB|nr:GntR family transcriptional regulator [Desulfosporosinus sp. FKA]
MLYPGSIKPLYEQLKDIIKLNITDGNLKPGEALPGERQLMETYGVSRVTIRQSIGELVNEGFLYRKHGKGTFVAPKRIERPLARLMGVTEELALDGLNVEMKVFKTESQKATPKIRQKLKLAEEEPVFCIARIITVAQEPLSLDYNYFPQSIGQKLLNANLSKDLIYTQLELYGYKISTGKQKISAGKATKEEAKLLQCKLNSPLLVVKRSTYVESGLPIVYSQALYRGDRYEYVIDLQRQPFGLEKNNV